MKMVMLSNFQETFRNANTPSDAGLQIRRSNKDNLGIIIKISS